MKPSNSRSLNPDAPCLVLAPHLEYPTYNGADISIDRICSGFSNYMPFVDIIARNTIIRYSKGNIVEKKSYFNPIISKFCAALLTVLHHSHYLLEKFLTKEFILQTQQYLSNTEYQTIIFSYIWTASILDSEISPDRFYCIWSHNDEIKWFDNFLKKSFNPLVKLIALFSKKWLRSFIKIHENDFLYLHVSKNDQDAYSSIFPNHHSYVVPIGVDINFDNETEEKESRFDKIRLIFVGALSVQMNYDALLFFKNEFFPLIKMNLKYFVEVLVIGSNPTRKVTNLCREMDWGIYPNVSDNELRKLYQIATFSILPFHYVTGAKLKLLHSLANGVPFLATSKIQGQIDKLLYPCLISDDPHAWISRIIEIKNRERSIDYSTTLKDYAKKYSWPVVASGIYQLIASYPITNEYK